MSASAVTLLPEPRLANDAERLAGVHRQTHTVDRPDDPFRRIEPDVQIVHIEKWRVDGGAGPAGHGP